MLRPALAALSAAFVFPQPALAADDEHTAGWKIPFDGGGGAVIVDNVIYVGSRDGAMYAFDSSTGQERWRFQTGEGLMSGPRVIIVKEHDPGSMLDAAVSAAEREARRRGAKREIHATPVVKDGVVYIGSMDCSFYGLDAATGELKWSFDTGCPVISSAVIADATVYIRSVAKGPDSAQLLHAIDAVTGKPRWSFRHNRMTEPAIDGGSLFVTTWDSDKRVTHRVFDALTGQERWSVPVSGGFPERPAAGAGLGYFVAIEPDHWKQLGPAEYPIFESEPPYRVSVCAVSSSSGEVRWESHTQGTDNTTCGPPLVGRNALYLAADGIYALDPLTGQLLWKSEGRVGNMWLGERLYAGRGNTLQALDPDTGNVIWSGRRTDNLWIQSVVDCVVYVSTGTEKKSLYAIDSRTGKQLWELKTGANSISAPPVKHGDKVYFSTKPSWTWGYEPEQGHLYCVDARTGKLK